MMFTTSDFCLSLLVFSTSMSAMCSYIFFEFLMHVRKVLVANLILALLAACQNTPDDYIERPAPDIYNTAMERLMKGSYSKAAESFLEIERQHPHSSWAIKSQLMAGFSYYQAKKYEEAIENFSVFISLHPTHKHVAYAHYMIGMCYYEQVPITGRDQDPTERAFDAFQRVIQEFPHSDYAKDARLKINFLQDHLAGKEMDVGRFYQNKMNHLAAVNRFKGVIDQYQTTSHTPEALHRLVESYLSLGLVEQAKASAAVLGHNYPGSSWYRRTYDILKKHAPTLVAPQQGPCIEPQPATFTAAQAPKPPVD